MNSSDSARFERAYASLWAALHRGDEPDLSQHERQLLHHVPADGGVQLNHIAWHLALPKSTASALVKDLERRGFVTRRRDPRDERRLAVTLTTKGRERVEADSVLDIRGLDAALADLSRDERRALVEAIEKLAEAARARREGARTRARQSPYSPANLSRT
ncbi:MAG TPA: MarR family winged helix-turn-helix transcriptional regulator [Candidatus Dormibacteraeota bacterium]|nr:MarR family winged helix-turn-helix transcriptional regulator [Candidatus Dormibacteraeota bacterium]